MQQYKDLLQHILDSNPDQVIRDDRTGTGTISVFGYQMRFDLKKGFPAQTTKKLAWKSVVGELLWFLEGSTNERRLAELTYAKDRLELKDKTTIWTANVNKQGSELGYRNTDKVKELGPVYGSQWRRFNDIEYNDLCDQVETVIKQIKEEPNSRRIIMSSWNPCELKYMTLPPCHVMCQFYVKDGALSCHMYQRSADVFLGVPFNIASYALLTHILARECDLDVADLIISFGDAHIYSNHIEQVQEVLTRECYDLPTLKIEDSFDLFLTLDSDTPLNAVNQFKLNGYKHHDSIKAEMAV